VKRRYSTLTGYFPPAWEFEKPSPHLELAVFSSGGSGIGYGQTTSTAGFLVYGLASHANLVLQSMNQNDLHAKADNKDSRQTDLGRNSEARTTKKARSSRHGHKSGEPQAGESHKLMPCPIEDPPVEGSLPLHRWLEESKADAPFYGIVVGGSNHTVTQDILEASNYSSSVDVEVGSEIGVHSNDL
jgi:hypothetical protein